MTDVMPHFSIRCHVIHLAQQLYGVRTRFQISFVVSNPNSCATTSSKRSTFSAQMGGNFFLEPRDVFFIAQNLHVNIDPALHELRVGFYRIQLRPCCADLHCFLAPYNSVCCPVVPVFQFVYLVVVTDVPAPFPACVFHNPLPHNLCSQRIIRRLHRLLELTDRRLTTSQPISVWRQNTFLSLPNDAPSFLVTASFKYFLPLDCASFFQAEMK